MLCASCRQHRAAEEFCLMRDGPIGQVSNHLFGRARQGLIAPERFPTSGTGPRGQNNCRNRSASAFDEKLLNMR